MTLNGLKTRIDRIENKISHPRVIKTWADLMRYAAGRFGDVEIPLSDKLTEVYEEMKKSQRMDMKALLATAPDAGIEREARRVLSKYPPEKDHLLSDEDREIIHRARVTQARYDARRDAEPTELREGK